MEYKDYLRMKQELIESGRTFAHTNAGSIYIIKEEINKEQAPLYAKYWEKVYKLTMTLEMSGTDAEMYGITYASERDLRYGDFEEIYQEMVDDMIEKLHKSIYEKENNYEIKPLQECCDKELRDCHDIRKLYLSGAFGEVYQIKNKKKGN